MEHPRSPRRFTVGNRPRLVLGGLAAAAGMSLAGCDRSEDYRQAEFTSVRACEQAGFDREVCDAGYSAAAQTHQETAPRFSSRDTCEQEWGTGQCAPALAGSDSGPTAAAAPSASGNVFVPMLAGFVISQALQQRYYSGGYIGGGFSRYGGEPIYRNRTGSTVTLDRSSGRSVATPVNVNTRTVASRGFGGRSMSRGGGFGG